MKAITDLLVVTAFCGSAFAVALWLASFVLKHVREEDKYED